jgi:hypothetical protein
MEVAMELNVRDYSEKSFVVGGELTKKYKDILKSMGGKFNRNLEGGPGWIFSKKDQEKVNTFVNSVNSGEFTNDVPSMNTEMDLPTVSAPPNSNSSYQYVRFKIFRPSEKQKVRLTTGGKTVEGRVTRLETHDGIVDTVYIDFDGKTSLGVICRSKWQIFGYYQDHTLFFTD